MANGKTEIAYAAIKNKILSGAIAPLSDISESEWQETLGISRTPIREAIQILEKEGFVYIYPRKSIIVSEITPELVREIFQMRELNEPALTVEASMQIDQTWLLKQRKVFSKMPDMAEQAQIQYFIEHDNAFHAGILEHCSNRFMRSIMGIVYDHSQRIRIKISRPTDKNDSSMQEHVDIIDAMLRRDADEISKKVLQHIEISRANTIARYNFQYI